MLPTTTIELPEAFRMDQIAVLALLYITVHNLETSAQRPGGCPFICGTCYDNLTCSSCQDYFTLYQGTCEPCGTNCIQCTHGWNCTLCEAGTGPIFNTVDCGNCSQSPGCSGICDKNGAGKCDACKPGYRLENTECRPCIVNCRSCLTNLTYCDSCFNGYGTLPKNKTCAPCSVHCTVKNTCFNYGAGTCDKCDPGYNWTPEMSCGPSTTTNGLFNTTELSRNLSSSFTFSSDRTVAMTTWITSRPSVENMPCPILEIVIGLGVPCGIIMLILVIIIIVLCVENRSLREYKRQIQESRQSHTILNSTASSTTLQPPLTQYEHLKTQNTQRDYKMIDRYETISTTETETTVHYETPSN